MKYLILFLSLFLINFSINTFAGDKEELDEAMQEELELEEEEKVEEVKEKKKTKLKQKTHNKLKSRIDTSRPSLSFKKELLERSYRKLYNTLKGNYVPNVVLQNLARDFGYSEGTSKLLLDAVSFLDRVHLEKLLSFYDERNSKDYKRLVTRIKRKKASRTDIPHARIFRDAIDYRYSKAKASKREKILLRINKLNKMVQTKDLSTYSLDELIKEIESRDWNIKLERHPASLKNTKKPII